MYEGVSFSADYERFHQQKKKRKRRMRRFICELLLLAGVLATAVTLMDRLCPDIVIPLKVFATPEKDMDGLESIEYEDLLDNIAEEEEPETETVPDSVQPSPVVFIDAGHGGNDGGCFEGNIVEKDINLAIAKIVEEKLTEAGFGVLMSRSDDTYVAKEDRVKMANEAQADIYVSIHQNSSDDRSVSGMEVWYEGTDAGRASKRLALLVSHQTADGTQASEREVRGDGEYYVTKNTQMPACLIETGFLSNKEERARLASREYQEQIAAGIVQGITYFFYPKTLYLTFDDGPSEENTARVLDILKQRNIKASFFLVGENVEKHPELVRRIAAEGHTIGIHCYSHDYRKLYESVESYVEDFERARKAVFDAAGVDIRIFRFPGGSINNHNKKVYADIIKEMNDRGYVYYDWNASLEDAAADIQPAQLVANGVQTTLGRNKVILLAHDVVYDTGTILDDLLDSLPEYEVRPLSEEVEPIQF